MNFFHLTACLFEHFPEIQILLYFRHFRDIQNESPVAELEEHHFFRLTVLQQHTSVHDAVAVLVFSNPD